MEFSWVKMAIFPTTIIHRNKSSLFWALRAKNNSKLRLIFLVPIELVNPFVCTNLKNTRPVFVQLDNLFLYKVLTINY